VCQPRARAQDRDNLRTYWSVRLAYGPAAWSVGDRRGAANVRDARRITDPFSTRRFRDRRLSLAAQGNVRV